MKIFKLYIKEETPAEEDSDARADGQADEETPAPLPNTQAEEENPVAALTDAQDDDHVK